MSQSDVVSFCAIQIELADCDNLLEVDFDCGKDYPNYKPPALSSFVRTIARGRRKLQNLYVETFTVQSIDAMNSSNLRRGSTDLRKEFVLHHAEMDNQNNKERKPPNMINGPGRETNPADNVDQISFVSGNPFVEYTKGLLHLYKEDSVTSLEEGVIRSPMICMLGVPAKHKTLDLLQLIAPCRGELEMIRIIHDNSPNQYMVLLKFRCQEAADEFYHAFNGALYNSFENDVCTLVYVSKVETCKESEYYPLPGHTELPVCSICLERMDESVSTVLTILCNHMFHGSCLSKWEDSTCPVCRYVQTPMVVAEQNCTECMSIQDLWICLICGYVGCGRYIGGHSYAHFKETDHCYTMELGQDNSRQNRVWDYVGDNFVHRLVQTDSADGKMVESQGNGVGSYSGEKNSAFVDGVVVNTDEKMDSIQLEYTYLLTTQLESQRRYYEDNVARIEKQAHAEIEEALHRAKVSGIENEKNLEKLTLLNRDKAKLEAKMNLLNIKYDKASKELEIERQLNQCLRQNQTDWSEKVCDAQNELSNLKISKEKEVQELEDQVRDLMFSLEAQSLIDKSSLLKEDLRGGAIGIPARSNTVTTSHSSKKSGGKKSKK